MRKMPAVCLLILIAAVMALPSFCWAADYTVFKERPRLYLNKVRLEELRKVKDQKPYSDFLKIIRKRGRWFVGNRVPNNLLRFDDNSLRRPADGLINTSFYYLITRDPGSFVTVQDLLRTFCSDPKWASNEEIGAAHSLFALSLAYDWFYYELSSALRLMVKDAIIEHAEIFYEVLKSKRLWWAQDRGIMQNHNFINTTAMAVAGIALYGEDSRARKWLDAAEKNFDRALSLLSPDGASHEGVGYWSYGTLWLLNYYMALAPAQGLDQVENSPHFRNTARFRLYASLPGFQYNVDFADSPIVDYKGPTAILRCLASIFDDSHAQWLADEIEDKKKKTSVLWQDYIWYDPNVRSSSPQDLPTSAWFDNLCILFSRSSWDNDASLVMYKCGPPQGFVAQERGIYTGSHIHPDEGQFSLWAGKNSLVQDDGYVMKKLTVSHNVLTFNKLGQLGEGGTWFLQLDYQNGRGNIRRPRFVNGDGFQAVEAELAGYYPASVRPGSWVRTFFVIDGSDIIVRDRVVPGRSLQVDYQLHLTRKAMKVDGGICLDFGSAYSVNLINDGGTTSFRRYSILTRPMGTNVSRIGMLYSTVRKSSVPFSMLTVIGRSANGCSDNIMVNRFDQAGDFAEIETKGGRFKINFSSLSMKRL